MTEAHYLIDNKVNNKDTESLSFVKSEKYDNQKYITFCKIKKLFFFTVSDKKEIK